MDELVNKLAGLGVVGIFLTVAMATSGYVGAAAISVALCALGPGGMVGGILTLSTVGLVTSLVAKYGIEKVVGAVAKEQLKTKSKEQIIKEIQGYPITKGLKAQTIELIKNC